MVSIVDVAKLAGVSDKTVSRVVNKEPNVREKTRERVQLAITELGYVPNLAARNIRTNKSRVIGVMTDVVATTPSSVEILRGIQDTVAETSRSVLIANTNGTTEGEDRVWRTFRENRIDGVVFATMYHRAINFDWAAPPLPMVMVNCFSPDNPTIPSFVPDDYQGGLMAAEFAIEQGHRKIAYLTLNRKILAGKLRESAFRNTLQSHGIEINENWIRRGVVGEVGDEQISAYNRTLNILDREAEDRPTAIICGNDEIALQAISAALTIGYKVPEDISIIGFDDFRTISEVVVPNLTTVALPYYEMGVLGAKRLLALLENPTSDKKSALTKMRCPLVKRQSC